MQQFIWAILIQLIFIHMKTFMEQIENISLQLLGKLSLKILLPQAQEPAGGGAGPPRFYNFSIGIRDFVSYKTTLLSLCGPSRLECLPTLLPTAVMSVHPQSTVVSVIMKWLNIRSIEVSSELLNMQPKPRLIAALEGCLAEGDIYKIDFL